MRKPLFNHFSPLILESKIDQQNHVLFKPLLGRPFSHLFQMLFKNGRFWDPLQNPIGYKIRSGSAEGPSRACQDGFRHSLLHYLALHPTSHHLFFMLSFWVSVSAGHPAIADARKGGFWEPRIFK